MFLGIRHWGPEHQANSQPAEGIPMRSVRTRKNMKKQCQGCQGQRTCPGKNQCWAWQKQHEITWNNMKQHETTWNKMKQHETMGYLSRSKWHDKHMFKRMAQPWRQVYIGAWIRIWNWLLSCIGPAAHATYHKKYQNIGIFRRQKATILLRKVKL